jgi:hypothetical protein
MGLAETDLTSNAPRALSSQRPRNGDDMQRAITIRHSTLGDQAALSRLAALDDRPPIEGDALLGFVNGELKAAVALPDGQAVADPFARTASLVQLLRHQLTLEPTTERRAA